MLTTVKLNHEISLTATEVHDVTADGMLAAELEAVCLSGAQTRPQLQFSVGLATP
jgi:hypothetical protein